MIGTVPAASANSCTVPGPVVVTVSREFAPVSRVPFGFFCSTVTSPTAPAVSAAGNEVASSRSDTASSTSCWTYWSPCGLGPGSPLSVSPSWFIRLPDGSVMVGTWLPLGSLPTVSRYCCVALCVCWNDTW